MPQRRAPELVVLALFATAGAQLWTVHVRSPRAPSTRPSQRATAKPLPPEPCDAAAWPPSRSADRDRHNQLAADRRDAAPDEICSIHHWITLCPVCDHRAWPAGSRFSDGTLVPRFRNLGCSCRWDDSRGESIAPPIVERWPLRPR